MDDFRWRDGVLHGEDVSLAELAARVGTPFYCYSRAGLIRRYQTLLTAFAGDDATFCYAVKANGTLAVIAALAGQGAGADVVSLGEMHRALAAGIPPERLVFSGVGKTAEEIKAALTRGILQLNVESAAELAQVSQLAEALGVDASVALRVNPDVAAGGHGKIATGRRHDKFGIAAADIPALYDTGSRLPGVAMAGLSMHIGSQITELAPFERAFSHLADLVAELRAAGHAVERLDLGGGLGVAYRPGDAVIAVEDYAACVRRILGPLNCRWIMEPGRFLAAGAGVLVSSVIHEKPREGGAFLIIDAGMNDLLRPALYDAHHEIVSVRESAPTAPACDYDVVGPVCESGDIFGRDRRLARLKAGDLVAITMAGAYGSVLASAYNGRPPPAEVMVGGGMWAVVSPRPDAAAMMAAESIPDWLQQ